MMKKITQNEGWKPEYSAQGGGRAPSGIGRSLRPEISSLKLARAIV
jgi:hypothetical protein